MMGVDKILQRPLINRLISKLKDLHNRWYVLGGHWSAFRRQWFIPSLSKNPEFPERVLDAGCGNSWVKKEFLRNGISIDYYGVDLGIGDANLEYQVTALADLHYLPFKETSFDKVFSNSVLEHVEHPEQVFAEMSRVTKVGGKIYLSVPFMWGLHQIPHDHHRFTKFALERYGQRNGLRVLHLWQMGGFFSVLRYLFSNYTLAALNDHFLWRAIFVPLTWIIKILDRTILAPLVHLLDKFDKFKDLTVGYFVIYEKLGTLAASDAIDSDPYRCPLCQEDTAGLRPAQNHQGHWTCQCCGHLFPVKSNIADLSLTHSIRPRSEKFKANNPAGT